MSPNQFEWRGIGVVMPTPLTVDDSVNVEELRALYRYIADGGADMIAGPIATGQYPALSREEVSLVMQTAIDTVGDEMGIHRIHVGQFYTGGRRPNQGGGDARRRRRPAVTAVVRPADRGGNLRAFQYSNRGDGRPSRPLQPQAPNRGRARPGDLDPPCQGVRRRSRPEEPGYRPRLRGTVEDHRGRPHGTVGVP